MTLSAPPPDSDDIINVILTELNLLHQGGYQIHSLIFPGSHESTESKKAINSHLALLCVGILTVTSCFDPTRITL